MKVLYYDCFAGISGDMNLGAMIDLGVDENYLIQQLSKLNICNEFKIIVKKDTRKGIEGTKVDVILKHHDDLSHNHDGHSHECEEHHHEHRNLKDIQYIIESSELSKWVKKVSLDIFMEVAKAESKVHGKDLYEVHFHEVGAVDSIVDIVGAAICLEYLKVDKVLSSSVEVGGGFVKCAHGIIPVPAPAVVEILRKVPITTGIVPYETTTPTGAAILKAVVQEFTDSKGFNIDKIGYGVGNRDTDVPNVLRVFLLEEEETQCTQNDKCFLIECNIDDMNPEVYDYVYEKLFEQKALDVYMTSIIMKKGRPGIKLSVICYKEHKGNIKHILLEETSTLGVREYEVNRTILKRDFFKVNTTYGEVSVKRAYLSEGKVKLKPEYDDCKRLALESSTSIKEIYEEVYKNI